MKTYLYETSDKFEKECMSRIPGKSQDDWTNNLIEYRKEIDEKISDLVRLRNVCDTNIKNKCKHPIEKRAVNVWYLTDTIGSNGWDDIKLVCRDCGITLKHCKDWREL